MKHEDKYKAYCKLCKKDIDLGKMGESALRSHERSQKHKDVVSDGAALGRQQSMMNFVIPPPPRESVSPSASATSGVSSFVSKNDVLKAEILWTIETVINHNSYKSNESVGKLFQTMFPDSQIAQKFTCGERKTAYFTVFGIGEYLKSLILNDIKGYFVILFDESLNKKSQKKQMDFHVRYWTNDKVITRYLGSVFMGHGKASDLLEHFLKGIEKLMPIIRNMLQVSMDGPNVNWKFFDMLKKQVSDEQGVLLINIGSCGLHVVHNAFKTGAVASSWDISSFLSSLYYLFKDSPARREDFQKVTGSSLMPLKFVAHRWMENVPVCERALLILPHIATYLEKVKSKELGKPTCKSFEVVSSKMKDKLLVSQLEFFRYIAMFLQPFLGNYQTDKPMVPFLMGDLSSIIRGLMKLIVKPDVLREAVGSKLFTVDLDEKDNLLSYTKVELGFCTQKALKDAVKEGKISERQNMEFRMECKAFVTKLLKKLLEKCPVTYSLVKNLSILDPREMVSSGDACKVKLKKVLDYLVTCNRVKERECDEIIRQYSDFIDCTIPFVGTEKFSGFNPNNDRVDEFFSICMNQDQHQKLFDIVKLCLVLSHGQATVERGFSVNKEVEVENLKEHSTIAQRMICDYVKSVGGILNVEVTKEMMQSASQARHKYEEYVAKQKEAKSTEQEKRKRKFLEESITELKNQAKQAKLDMESLSKSADQYAVKAEKERNFSHIAKSNALRDKAKEKSALCEQLNTKLSEKLQELKTV